MKPIIDCIYKDKCIHYGNLWICSQCKHNKGKKSYFEPEKKYEPVNPRYPWDRPWRCVSSNISAKVDYNRW